jgi:transcriptional regulator with XRE-family HTH domain
MMERSADLDINARIAARVRALRAAAELTLDALAERSGVSRAMISRVERGESSPTAVVLDKLATGLGVPLAALFDAAPAAQPSPIARHADQPTWRDPASQYVRRNLSPPGYPSPLQLVEVTFPAGARVRLESGPRHPRLHQQIFLLAGSMEITVDRTTHQLARGDCLAMELDAPTAFHNPGRSEARYLVVITADPERRRAS